MKLGRCPSCNHRLVLVKVYRCGCGQRHTRIAQRRGCPTPRVELVVRRHPGCEPRLRPLTAEELRAS